MAQNLKVILLGYGSSGKTSLLISFTTKRFPGEYIPTVFDNYSIWANFKRRPFQVSLWDSTLREDGWRLLPLSFPQTSVFVLCYAVNWPASLEALVLQYWPLIQRHYEQNKHEPRAAIVLVGLKSDLRSNPRVVEQLKTQGKKFVSSEDVQAVAEKLGAVGAYEVSSLDYANAMVHLPDDVVCKPEFVTPVGGVDFLFDAIFKAGLSAQSNNNSQPKVKQGFLSRIFGRVSNSRPHQQIERPLTDQAGFDKATAVLMCRHPRLGQNCPDPMRQLPAEIWLSIFRLVATSDTRVEFLR